MRIADKMAFDQVKNNVSKNRKQMADLQNQAATQKRVTKPSDDPLAASRVLGARVDLSGKKQFSKSLDYAKSFLELTDQSLGELSENLMRVKELALSQSNDASASEETRKVVATEVEQLYNHMVQIGNRKLGDRFIFGGFKTTSSPFGHDGQYKGDDGEILIHIDKDSFLSMNLPGNRVFLGQGVSATEGVSAPALDQARTIEDWNAQQHKLPQNPEEVRAPASQGMRLPTDPQPEVNDTTGKFAPEEEAMFPWSEQSDRPGPKGGGVTAMGVNLFSVLKDLELSLRTNDKAGVQDSLDVIDEALSQVVLSRSQVGSRSMVLDNYFQTLEKSKVDNQIMISQLEDADIFSTVSDINKTESTLQATLQTSGKLIQKSLLDFLG